jgi:hypothetical protein
MRVDHKTRYSEPVKDAENSQQPEQARDDAGKAHQIELPAADVPQMAPSPDGPRGNKKAGNDKEDDDAVITAPEHDPVYGSSQERAQASLIHANPQINVVQYYSQNAEPAQHIDALHTLFLTLDWAIGPP